MFDSQWETLYDYTMTCNVQSKYCTYFLWYMTAVHDYSGRSGWPPPHSVSESIEMWQAALLIRYDDSPLPTDWVMKQPIGTHRKEWRNKIVYNLIRFTGTSIKTETCYNFLVLLLFCWRYICRDKFDL